MKKYFAGALLVVLSMPAMAQSPEYNYAQLTWQSVSLDSSIADVDGDGFGIGGSFEIADNWHIVAGYSDLGFDFDIDLTEFLIGAGYHTDISTNTSFFGELAYVRAEVSQTVVGNIDESGVGIRIGLRSNVSESIELEGNLSYVDLGDGGDGTSVGGAAWYKFSENFAVGLTAGFEEDVNAFGLGARLYF